MMTPSYTQLAALARPLYPAHGQNSWDHIQDVRRRALKMMRKLENRGLTPDENAAILFHDNTKRRLGGEDHGRTGAAEAVKIQASAIPQHNWREATEAIAVHDDNLKEFPSHTAELLASADANPPLTDWVLNKSYNFGIKMNEPEEKRISLALVAKKYGQNGTFNYPDIYKRYYGDKNVNDYRSDLSTLTLDEAHDIVRKYRKANNIPDNAIIEVRQ